MAAKRRDLSRASRECLETLAAEAAAGNVSADTVRWLDAQTLEPDRDARRAARKALNDLRRRFPEAATEIDAALLVIDPTGGEPDAVR